MQIVIDIPEEVYKAYKISSTLCMLNADQKDIAMNYLINGLINGTPLPKGHGGLITKEQAIELVEFYQINPQHFDFVNLIEDIKDEKPIIEADKE